MAESQTGSDNYEACLVAISKQFDLSVTDDTLRKYAQNAWPQRDDMIAQGVITSIDATTRFDALLPAEKLPLAEEYRQVLQNMYGE